MAPPLKFQSCDLGMIFLLHGPWDYRRWYESLRSVLQGRDADLWNMVIDNFQQSISMDRVGIPSPEEARKLTGRWKGLRFVTPEQVEGYLERKVNRVNRMIDEEEARIRNLTHIACLYIKLSVAPDICALIDAETSPSRCMELISNSSAAPMASPTDYSDIPLA